MRDWGIPLSEVADMAVYLPPDSAVRRALDEHWQRTPEIDLLREIEHDLRIIAWQKTKDGQRGIRPPEPLRLPWDPPSETDKIVGDVMTTDEMAKWLGWDKLLEKGGT
jgi:hypothetical protein